MKRNENTLAPIGYPYIHIHKLYLNSNFSEAHKANFFEQKITK